MRRAQKPNQWCNINEENCFQPFIWNQLRTQNISFIITTLMEFFFKFWILSAVISFRTIQKKTRECINKNNCCLCFGGILFFDLLCALSTAIKTLNEVPLSSISLPLTWTCILYTRLYKSRILLSQRPRFNQALLTLQICAVPITHVCVASASGRISI